MDMLGGGRSGKWIFRGIWMWCMDYEEGVRDGVRRFFFYSSMVEIVRGFCA